MNPVKLILTTHPSSLKRQAMSGVALTLLLVFICLLAGTGRAAAAQTVTVGYYYDSDYMYKTKSGEHRGYDIELLYELAKYTGWRYKFIDYKDWDDCYSALLAGKIDVLPALFWSKERAAQMIFSNKKMTDVYITVITRTNDAKYSYGDASALSGARIGILKNSLDAESFKKWCAKQKLNVRTVELDGTEEMLKALDEGKIDAASVTYLGRNYNYRIIAEFDPQPLFFAFPRDRGLVKKQLDDAMDKLAIANPGFDVSMRKKYFSQSAKIAPAFTKQERDYIAQKHEISVSMLDEDPPFSYLEGGRIKGILPDLYDFVAGQSGLRFKYELTRNRKTSAVLVAQGRAQVMSRLTDNVFIAARKGVQLTVPYLSMTITSVERKGTARVRTAAVPEGDAASALEEAAASGAELPRLRCYDSAALCFKALDRGEVDAVYCSTMQANYFLARLRSGSYQTATLAALSYGLCAGVSYRADAQLYPILSKCFRGLDSSKLDEIVLRDTLQKQLTLTSLVNRMSSLFLAVVVLILAAFVLLLTALLRVTVKSGARLRQSQELHTALLASEKARAAKSEFLSNISHDMRTPLNGIIGYTGLALESRDPVQMREYLGKIRISGSILLDLINDTLELSKLENGKILVEPKAADLHLLLEKVVVPIRSMAAKKDIRFSVDDSGIEPGLVKIDSLNMQKIFINLLSNAVKFTPNGGKVEFTARRLDEPQDGCNCLFTVRDSGIGISPEFMPRLFEPFAQEHTGTTAGAQGTGLGLAIVKQLVNLMNGRIQVRSEPGRGTEFKVLLNIEQTENKTVPAEAAPQSRRNLSGKKILLCEDNEMNAEIARALLEGQGMQVTRAADGEQGLSLFTAAEEDAFDAVLMDLRMPKMDGYTAAASIRKLSRSDAKKVPIIAMSADAFAEDIKKAENAGMNAHVAKPIDPESLFGTLEKFCGSNKS